MEPKSNIILFPEFVALKKEVEALRGTLSDLLLYRDQLEYVECRNIGMRYMLAVGHLEYKAYELQITVQRYKRKIDMIRTFINRQEPIDMKKIDEMLQREFELYQEQLQAHLDEVNDALERRSNSETLSKEDAAELKELYRKVVKSLHPDLNPNVSESEIALFNNAVEAYKAGNLERLIIVSTMVKEVELPDKNDEGMSLLVRDKKRLNSVIRNIEVEIDKIKSRYPYTKKAFVNDKEAVEEKKQELQSTIDQFNDAIIRYKAIMEEMVG